MPAPLPVCFTPDRLYFVPAVFTAASLLAQDDADGLEILFVCEEADAAPGFERLDPRLRARITLLPVDWAAHVADLPTRGHFTSAVNRRLALHRVLPERCERFVSMDADMQVIRPGLASLASLDLRGLPLAAAYDMIFLKDFEDGPLTAEFRAYRGRLGLAPDTPYFNNGLTLVDRHAWTKARIPEQAAERLRGEPGRYPFLEQSALNSVIHGAFAPLSPRFNFMGDFLLLDLEDEIRPVVRHFVNRPKPWEPGYPGAAGHAQAYRDWLERSPWPELAGSARPSPATLDPTEKARFALFRERLRAFLGTVDFADGWKFAD
ncbi:hypothetical protein SLNSH_20980 [Alsobacter soli]|uniref:Glycosyltransferase family 8 protein n=1 Tax=Alsobacter soli TaxID=2109933 RepID=A0A2T1HMW5_9HYPH|nr:glycosyltransferase [Alsobacter soli]PSC02988.1 hypothetical protein SLNSH_20980 [Alsobacter soli]